MNRLLPRSIKSAYRKERLTSLVVLAGLVDILIGGFGDRTTLVAFGLLIVLGSVAWRWLQMQPIQSNAIQPVQPRRYLPRASSRTPLPLLTNEKFRS